MNFLLKIFFFITFYLFTTIFAIISLPLLFFPRKFLKLPLRLWAYFLNLILHAFFKIDFQINGELPKNSRMQLFGDKFSRYKTENGQLAIEKYFKIAERYNLDLSQLSLKFCPAR